MSVKGYISVVGFREVEERVGRGERAKLGEGAGEDSRPYDQLLPSVPEGLQMLRSAMWVTACDKAYRGEWDWEETPPKGGGEERYKVH